MQARPLRTTATLTANSGGTLTNSVTGTVPSDATDPAASDTTDGLASVRTTLAEERRGLRIDVRAPIVPGHRRVTGSALASGGVRTGGDARGAAASETTAARNPGVSLGTRVIRRSRALDGVADGRPTVVTPRVRTHASGSARLSRRERS
jgi:hypothetical protein